MLNILSFDSFRKSVEASSNNNCTVLYDDKGYPSIMHVIPKVTIGECFPSDYSLISASDMTSVHPAFIIKEADDSTTVVNEIYVGQYLSNVVDNRAISLPGQFIQETQLYGGLDIPLIHQHNQYGSLHLLT